MEYRGVSIILNEQPAFGAEEYDQSYTVSRQGGMVFAAASRFGIAYATKPQDALDDVKAIIDRKLGA